ncbi:peptidase inhibitor family I36 protein [Amycolatopsis sp. NPDC051758]|uniref:peptidase inhibitor family I36 protein n=1 Tax=Amycolatopsis sp. NPDC051758 TaxID=3363935 RepID=UPI0037974DA6
MRVKRVLTGLAASAAVITGTTVAAPAASAADLHGCPDFYLCFYFNSNFEGALANYAYSDGNLDNEVFRWGGTNGRGVQVKNNAASVINNAGWTATVYYNSGCNGSVASQSFGMYGGANFTPTMKNNNASFKWPSGPVVFSDCAKRDQD